MCMILLTYSEVVRLCGYNLYFENIFVHLSFIQVSIFELVE